MSIELATEEAGLLAQALLPWASPAQPTPDPQALGHLARAAEHLGLQALQDMLEVVQINLLSLADATSAPPWAGPLLTWLHNPSLPQAAQAAAQALTDPAWPHPADADTARDWVQGLLAVRLQERGTEPGAPAPVADADALSLALPPDIDTHLLNSLLSELPSHAQALCELVQALQQSPQPGLLQQARRVAHTLKGASQTVGVRGVGNFTHALEDLLLTLQNRQQLPDAALCELLLQAADCLQDMSDALLGHGAAPVHGPQLLRSLQQATAQWRAAPAVANSPPAAAPVAPPPGEPPTAGRDSCAASGAATDDADTEPAAASTHASTPDSNPEPGEADNPQAWVRLSAARMDRLLDLGGEQAIQETQLAERLQRLDQELAQQRSNERQLRALAAELEQQVDFAARTGPATGTTGGEGLDALELEDYSELHTVVRRIVEAARDSRELVASLARELDALHELAQAGERTGRELRREVEDSRLLPFESIAPRLQRTVRQAARVLGREVRLELVGMQTRLDSALLEPLLDPLMHLLRNAVDHGIEPAAQRLAAGKPAQGLIRLQVSLQGQRLQLLCSDDGPGLQPRALRERAQALGMVGPEAAPDDAQALQLILLPGFSTRKEATLISGRGLGMDVVRRAVQGLRGRLELRSPPGQGLQVLITLPGRLSAARVLLCRSGPQTLALAEHGVQALLDPHAGLHTDDQGRLAFHLEQGIVAAWRLQDLLGLPADALPAARGAEVAVLVPGDDGRPCVVIVPEITHAGERVVKPLPAGVQAPPGVEGLSVLGDGTVVTVLDLPALLRARQEQPPLPLAGAAVALPARPLCLVVDDSVSVRHSTTQWLGDTGYEVIGARDGLQALEVLAQRTPDIVLVDLEMPRMNGLELTRAMRQRPATRHTPVVMISSRLSARHRQLALQAGVDEFHVKPYAEDELLAAMEALRQRR